MPNFYIMNFSCVYVCTFSVLLCHSNIGYIMRVVDFFCVHTHFPKVNTDRKYRFILLQFICTSLCMCAMYWLHFCTTADGKINAELLARRRRRRKIVAMLPVLLSFVVVAICARLYPLVTHFHFFFLFFSHLHKAIAFISDNSISNTQTKQKQKKHQLHVKCNSEKIARRKEWTSRQEKNRILIRSHCVCYIHCDEATTWGSLCFHISKSNSERNKNEMKKKNIKKNKMHNFEERKKESKELHLVVMSVSVWGYWMKIKKRG